MKQNKGLKNAYAAGLLDGEGCIRITKIPPREKGISPQYELIVFITQKDGRMMDWLVGNFGGFIYLKNKKSFRENTKNWIYEWHVNNSKAYAFLKAIYPFVTTKKNQVEIAMRFQSRLNSSVNRLNKRKLSENELRIRESLRLSLSAEKTNFHSCSVMPQKEYMFNSLCAGLETKSEHSSPLGDEKR